MMFDSTTTLLIMEQLCNHKTSPKLANSKLG